MRFPLVIAVLILGLGTMFVASSGPQARGDTALKRVRQAEQLLAIPVTVRNHLPTTTVWVNGEPHDLFLDLAGAAEVALTPDELSSTSVEYLTSNASVRNAMGQATNGRRFLARSVRVGGQEIGPVIGDEWHIGAYGPPDRNGYLGMGFFTNQLMVLDYAKGSVRLYPGRNPERLRSECGRSQPFELRVENGIAVSVVETEVGTLRVLWDTGSTDNVARSRLLLDKGLKSLPVEDGPPVFSFQHFAGLGVAQPLPQFRDVPFQAPDVDLVLGTPFFRSNKVCLDLAAGQGAVQPY